jgi:hypothetical protein
MMRLNFQEQGCGFFFGQVAAKADLARIETVLLHFAIQAGPVMAAIDTPASQSGVDRQTVETMAPTLAPLRYEVALARRTHRRLEHRLDPARARAPWVVSFESPADAPAMPGMLRKSAAFAPRYRKFESISLQQRVWCELDLLETWCFPPSNPRLRLPI